MKIKALINFQKLKALHDEIERRKGEWSYDVKLVYDNPPECKRRDHARRLALDTFAYVIATQFEPLLGRYFKNSTECFKLEGVADQSVGVKMFSHTRNGYMNGGLAGRCDAYYCFWEHIGIRLSFHDISYNTTDIMGAEEISEGEFAALASKSLSHLMRAFVGGDRP